jgi:molecular chaperone HtpG
LAIPIEDAALLAFLRLKESALFAKIIELRNSVEDWLSYIPQTFPHYTRHTAKHSDAIVLQMSKVLFYENDAARPVLSLSPMEAYIGAAAAYLHDAGMVTSDKEKEEILLSDAWKAWISEGSGRERSAQIEAFRKGGDPPDPALRNFIADRQIRFLIAEFVRRTHHFRAKEIMSLHQERLGLFAFGDPVLLRTIGDVCVAHGLEQKDLEDRDRYPARRDVAGEQVSVQFVALLLRLGDLLDMSHDRACPLLLSAACPLPPESLAHWSQYQRISHFLTAPDVIEIGAECENQEEHRYLTDWCQWLVNELQNASVLMSRSARHSSWRLPAASMEGPGATIKIVPSATAKYIPRSWRFEIDPDSVFTRLIEDVYESPIIFIRELIQNALDATRCQMQMDLQARGIPVPDFPTQVDESIRTRYPIRMALETREIQNYLSGHSEKRQVFSIDDAGIGMDADIIQRYFLQVGRSYYTTSDFQRRFRFVPTSRFGLGFLSVFGASDSVVVETFKPTSPASDGPLRLSLSGPKNYLLIEKGRHRSAGTRIEVVLRSPMGAGEVTDAVSHWCRKVEFPVIVNELGSETRITPEAPEEFEYEMPDVTEPSRTMLVRHFNVARRGIEGELYVFATRDSRGESWSSWSWAKYSYPTKHPQASAPPFPQDLRCINGIATDFPGYGGGGPMASRVDYRDGSETPVLARNAARRDRFGSRADPRLLSRWEEILREHLASAERASGPEKWKYIQELVRNFPLQGFWDTMPDAIPVAACKNIRLLPLSAVVTLPTLATTVDPDARYAYGSSPETSDVELLWESATPLLTDRDARLLSEPHLAAIFGSRKIENASWHPSGKLVLLWVLGREQWESWNKPILWCDLPDSTFVGARIHKTTDNIYGTVLLNTRSALVQWALRVKNSCAKESYGLKASQYERLRSMLYESVAYWGNELENLVSYLRGWREIPGLPPDLYPPAEEPTRDQFRLRAPSSAEDREAVQKAGRHRTARGGTHRIPRTLK